MTWLQLCLVLTAIPAVLLAAGYGVARRVPRVSPAERCALAVLTGLCGLLLSISIVNAALPLSRGWSLVCLLPWVAPLAGPAVRRQFADDLTALVRSSRIRLVAGAAFVVLLVLLWPLFTRPDVVFYDGSASHDAFFWIVGAEHLQRSTYLITPASDSTHPLYYAVGSIIGLQPAWGRMGAEGLLAWCSSGFGLSPLQLYLATAAALFVPWLAAEFLVIKTFFAERIPSGCAILITIVQPVFVFFYANANLPNLLGALAGTLAIVTTARAVAPATKSRTGLIILPLAIHGVLCTYPEVFPVVALTMALLVVRLLASAPEWRPSLLHVGLAAVLGVVINPLTAVRAWYGFFCSLGVARAGIPHPDIFASLPLSAKFPAMSALSADLGHALPPAFALLCGGAIVVGAFAAIARARDRIGAAGIYAGVAVMSAYTLATHFEYGWQKTVQFSGVFVAALLPGAALIALTERTALRRIWRLASAVVVLSIVALFGYATAANVRELVKWSHRKFITTDWYAASEYSRHSLRNKTVLVDSAGFSWPFFYTMWSTYFFTESRLYFTADGAAAGYLRPDLQRHPPDRMPRPRAILVGADSAAAQHAPDKWRRGPVALVLK